MSLPILVDFPTFQDDEALVLMLRAFASGGAALTVDDGDFVGASDHVAYAVPISEGSGPFTVEAELLYQPIGYRWATNLKPYNAPEPMIRSRIYCGAGATRGAAG